MITRRDFLKTGIAAGFGGIIVPPVLAKGVAAATLGGTANDHVLVVLQLGGGNDGLNTVIPLTDPAYGALRPTLGIKPATALPLTADTGLHPALVNTQRLYQQGQVAVVQGVGYDNPSYSHFQSMYVWQHADPTGRAGDDGWLGKFLQSQLASAQQPLCTCALNQSAVPGELVASADPPVTVLGGSTLSLYGGASQEAEARSMYTATPGPWGVLMDNNVTNLANSIDALGAAAYTPSVSYTAPGATQPSSLAASFQMAAKLIATQPATKILHISYGSFDTHEDQLNRQQALLADVDFAIGAFLADLAAHGQAQRVSVMTWSEFGRRAQQNGSTGTDHGSASPVLLYGAPVSGGLKGAPCSLTALDNGNLVHTTDFRSVYQSVVQDWLGGDAVSVLGGSFPQLALFR